MIEFYREVELAMKAAVDHLHHEMKSLRTGRASLALLEGVTVDYYGTATPLNQLAGLSVPEATLIIAQPYDPASIPAIERAIQSSELGLNPANDGKVVRVPVPPLTGERRQQLVKLLHELAESARNSVRHSRREGNDELKRMTHDKEIGEDDEHRGFDEIQKLHDHYIGLIQEAVDNKEADILEV